MHEVVIGMTNGSGDGRLRGIGTDRKGVITERKRVERKKGGGKGDFLGFVLFSTPLKKPCPFFFNHTP